MGELDIGKAAFAGLGVIRRHPAALVVWGLMLFVLGMLPILGMWTLMATSMAELIAAEAAGVEPSPEQMINVLGGAYALQPLAFVGGVLSWMLFTGAVFRSVLHPGERAWFFLRLGVAELLMAAVTFVVLMMIGLAAMFLVGVGAVIALVLYEVSEAAGVILGLLVGLACLVGAVFFALRFSLAAPMSFAERNFRLLESWRMTRGHTLGLLAVGFLSFLVFLLVEMLIFALGVGVLLVVGVSLDPSTVTTESVEAFFKQDPAVWMAGLAPWVVGLGLVGSIASAALRVLLAAPWAEVYRQLAVAPTIADPAP